MICKHCQKEMPLRSFRPPPNRCVHCDQLQDPDLPRANYGCLVLTPVAILLAIASGYIGLQVGRLLAPVLQIPGLEITVACLAAFDALAGVCIFHVRRFCGPAEQSHAGPVALALMFFLIGARCARGMGIDVVVWTGLINALFASVVTVGTLRIAETTWWPMAEVDVQTEILINRPREQVADYASNPDNVPHWYDPGKTIAR